MAEATFIAEGKNGGPETPPPVHDERGDLSEGFVGRVRAAIAANDAAALRAYADELHEADLAALIEVLDPDERTGLIRLLGEDFDFTALTELDETLRVSILEALPAKTVAEGVRELDSDDAVTLLEDLEPEEQAEILAELPPVERAAVARSLEYPEESAGRLMQTDFVAVPPFWNVGQAIDYMREAEDLPDEFYMLFVVDAAYHLVGTVALGRLLRSKRPTPIAEIMDTDVESVKAADDQEDVARRFERYNLIAAPVVDDNGRLVGVITVDDVVDVIEAEADEDMRLLGGVGDEEISDSVVTTARLRLPWLMITLLTASVSATVISVFEGTIEALVALAVLLPVNAALGGNAGTQALTVTVRALATRDLRSSNKARVVGREALVGLLNGAVLATIAGTAVGLIFQNAALGAVLAAAMVATVLFATLLGILVPLILDRTGIDPAIASGVFVTTTTDVFGFFTFLGLATLLIAHL